MTIRVSRVDGVQISAAQDRRALYGGWTTGIYFDIDGLVEAQATPNMTVQVAPIRGLLMDDGVSSAVGKLVFESDASVNVTIATANATNPRIDLVVAKVTAVEFGGADAFTLVAVTGTPAASPAAPAVPTRCYALAEVRVEAGVTTIVSAKITDRRSLARLLGPKIQSGTFGASFVADTVKTGTLTFPTAFSAAPVVVGTVTIGSNLRVSVGWDSNPTATQVAWRAFQSQGSSITGSATIHWVAIGD